IQGRAYGLSVADGLLVVSTDQGGLYAFDASNSGAMTDVSPSLITRENYNASHNADVQTMIDFLKRDKGYALVLSESFSQWADAFQTAPNLHLAGIDRDEEQVQSIRKAFYQRRDYGTRVSFHHVVSGPLPFTDYVFNLIVCDMPSVIKYDEGLQDVLRMLRPHGGVLALKKEMINEAFIKRIQSLSSDFIIDESVEDHGWLLIRRGGLPGEGQWTHPFSNIGNSANSGDQRIRGQMQVQWFGRPGPNRLIDRHHRSTPPLSLNGTSLLYGNEVLTAFDSYNGTMLWEHRVPDTLRVGIPYDAGNLAMSDESVYLLSKDECLRFNTKTGVEMPALSAPQLGKTNLHWGYLATDDGLVFGSAEEPGAAREHLSRDDVVEQYNEFRPLPLSQY
ncbi:class I SAM-dependent methyltransferase, partial [bacterium]|nr:class I SAM-dependent methyltransferase [bacterium]